MATTEKARMIALRLADELKLRVFPALAFAETTGTAGDPVINIGTGADRSASATIRVVPFPAPLAKDILGLTSPQVALHVVQLATEANFAGTTDNIADNLTRQQLMNILGPCVGTGCKVEWYEEADGTGPSETTIDPTKLKAEFTPNPYFPLGIQ